ncbi:VWA domain-containing protein [Lysobacter yananisis]|uniref:VWA domain-containing protein n=1 Tax=Lysobacter yananisis TaxID=1003114 RepID=A0ABY9P969_9GAMM|nr:VWA domain-containing protein [Lysobacter yananisis]WMT03622.1 VWA domain-containing protein [Lysobacter yananisis]
MNPSAWFEHLAPLTFLRPQWLWALLALPLLGAWWWRSRRQRNVWQGAVDAHLLPHLLDAAPGRRSQLAAGAAALGYALAVLALAGPSWSQGEQPLWQGSTPMVVALDLSSRSLAGDLPPSRLAQARAKLAALLRARAGGGQIALVVYADDAFTVAPLTDDPDNISVFLDSLAPDIMPGDGQRSDRAIAWSARLLRQGGFKRGRIVLITDRGDSAADRAAAKAAGDGYSVSVLGLGSASGAAFQRPDGRIVKVRLDTPSLQDLVRAGNGRYAALSADDSDLRALQIGNAGSGDARVGAGAGEKRLAREDDGYWLLPPLLLLALFAFRRRAGAGALALLLCLGLPLATAPARAQSLWQRADQSAHERIVEGNQAYRSGRFEQAGELYQRGQGADAQYNLGNALARQGRYPEAIAAYDRALKQQPGMADALANKRAVEAAMKRPPPQNQNGKGQQQKPSSGSKQDDPKPQPSDSQQKPDGKPQSPPPKPDPDGKPQDRPKPADDPEQQRRADQEQRERMQRELERQRAQQPPPGAREPARTPAQRERQQANDAWLKRVPDDPGSLLRERFKIEYARRQMSALEGD